MNSNKSIKIISIDGNIGSGKSTLLEHLKLFYNQKVNVIFLREPVDEWEKITDTDGNTMLQKFYAEQQKYSFAFQMMAYISRLSILRETIREYTSANKNITELIIITERSLFTDKHVFAKMLHDNDMIEDVTFQIYLKWFDEFARDFPIDSIVYVKTDPDICHNRIRKRARTGEDVIPLTYLENCHKYHEDFIDTIGCNKLYIDGNVDITQNTDIINDWIIKINSYIFSKTIYPFQMVDAEYILKFDGCSKGNPGQAGIGAVIYKNNNEIWSNSKYIGIKTNNVAEYSALIFGLNSAVKLKINKLVILGDSQLVINQINGIYKVKNETLIPLYEMVIQLKRYFSHITFTHIYRTENKRADELANIGLENQILYKVEVELEQ